MLDFSFFLSVKVEPSRAMCRRLKQREKINSCGTQAVHSFIPQILSADMALRILQGTRKSLQTSCARRRSIKYVTFNMKKDTAKKGDGKP